MNLLLLEGLRLVAAGLARTWLRETVDEDSPGFETIGSALYACP